MNCRLKYAIGLIKNSVQKLFLIIDIPIFSVRKKVVTRNHLIMTQILDLNLQFLQQKLKQVVRSNNLTFFATTLK